MYDGMMASLQTLYERLVRQLAGQDPTGLRLPVNKDDIAFLVEDVWRGKSAVSRLGNRLVLIPWQVPAAGFGLNLALEKEGQKTVAVELDQLVCMTKEEAARHEREVLHDGKNVSEIYDAAVLQRVDMRKKEAQAYEQYR
jgi:hypothetical protein